MTPEELVAERSKTHGDFYEVAYVAQWIRNGMRARSGWERLSVAQCEALDSIAGKIARIICGDPNFVDHWDDIAGYALLGKIA